MVIAGYIDIYAWNVVACEGRKVKAILGNIQGSAVFRGKFGIERTNPDNLGQLGPRLTTPFDGLGGHRKTFTTDLAEVNVFWASAKNNR